MASNLEMAALLIAPDRGLAEQFLRTIPETRAFQVLGDLKSYPHEQALDIRLRQLKPDVVLLDVATDPGAAARLIRFIAASRPDVQVVGLHTANDPEAILRTLRGGASEFLHAPFEVATQREAIARLERLRASVAGGPERGSVAVFTSAKPGSGASTLATQTAFALRRATGKKILLADFDLMGGAIAFYLKLNPTGSLVDALESSGRMDAAFWSSLTVNSGGVDVLPAPETPRTDPVDTARLSDVLEYARRSYDWVVVDLPSVFQQISLLTLADAERAFLVTTSELPSLHLTRKAVNMLAQLGIDKTRFQVVVNRMSKRDGIGQADMEKVFNCPVHASFPNDYFSLHRVVTHGQPLNGDCELGRAIDRLAGKLWGAAPAERRRAESRVEVQPALSQT
ncbi:MAG: P-loop NTPase [Acidobacteria bacterium]|nr:P-loop NTPase [Acidobacteriota bacterium]